MTPPVWTAILATILIRERLTRPRIIAVVFGIAGMLIILRQAWLISTQQLWLYWEVPYATPYLTL